jgi:hypothetical protein
VYGSVGSVIYTDADLGIGNEVRRSVCVVCTAACLVELDVISGPRSDPKTQLHRRTTLAHKHQTHDVSTYHHGPASRRLDGDAVAAGRGSGRSSVGAHRGPGCTRRGIAFVTVCRPAAGACVCCAGEIMLACVYVHSRASSVTVGRKGWGEGHGVGPQDSATAPHEARPLPHKGLLASALGVPCVEGASAALLGALCTCTWLSCPRPALACLAPLEGSS